MQVSPQNLKEKKDIVGAFFRNILFLTMARKARDLLKKFSLALLG